MQKKIPSEKIPLILAKNTLWMTSGLILRVFLQITYFLIVTRSLKPEEYGLFAGVLAMVTVLSPFVSWGSGNILIEHVSRQAEQFSLYWGMSIIVTLISSSLLGLISFCLGAAFFSLNVAVHLVLPLTIGTFIGEGFVNLSGQAFQAHQKLAITSIINVSLGILRLMGASILLLPISKTAENWSILYMASSLICGLFSLFWVKTNLGWGHLLLKQMKGKWLEGFYYSIGISAQGIYNDIDKTLLSSIVSNTTGGLYTSAYRIMDASFMPLKGLLSSTYPQFFKEGEKGIKDTSKLAIRLLPWSMGYGLIAMAGLIIISPFITFFLGSAYNGTSAILRWLSPIPLFRSFQYVIADSLTGAGYQKFRSIFQIGIAILNLVLNIFWIPKFGWLGAAWSSLISDGLLAICLWGLTLILIKKE